jgi:mRNA interferase MazF
MNRGDVVEVDWPFSDLTGSKTRPALVIQADFLNALIDDTILVQITSTRHAIPNTEVVRDPAFERDSGLTKICVVNCMNILTFDQGLIGRTIGFLSAAALLEVEECLKSVLGIP